MPSLRLNQTIRSALTALASRVVAAPTEAGALEATYDKASALVRRCVEGEYPPKDMKVCAKYEAAFVDDCIKLNLTAGGIEQFTFKDKTGPLVAKKTYSGKIYQADAETTDAVTEWIAARDAHKQALKSKLSDYDALIQNARTLEAVSEVWPEAEELRQRFGGRAITVISPDVIARIQADFKSRAA